jgi:hypothetical protein
MNDQPSHGLDRKCPLKRLEDVHLWDVTLKDVSCSLSPPSFPTPVSGDHKVNPQKIGPHTKQHGTREHRTDPDSAAELESRVQGGGAQAEPEPELW